LVSFVLIQSAACARPPASGARVRIAVGGLNQLIYLPTTLARELGFYREEGLDVELQDHAGGSKALQAMVGGSADVVSGFYDHTIQMAAEGRELVAFVTILRYPGLVLVTSPRTSVTKIEDLKAGRRRHHARISSHMLLTFLLHRHGVEADAVSVTDRRRRHGRRRGRARNRRRRHDERSRIHDRPAARAACASLRTCGTKPA
jgi:NitT/TauT family transport system substrate-binding protein